MQDLVHEGVVKLVKCTCMHNMADTLTKSVPFPVLEKHREYLFGSGVPFFAFWTTICSWSNVAVFPLRIS